LRAKSRAVEPGHADVEHDRVRTGSVDALARLHGARSFFHIDVHGFESRAEKCAKSVVVVNQQEAQGGHPPFWFHSLFRP
jgi:hypothetical protein